MCYHRNKSQEKQKKFKKREEIISDVKQLEVGDGNSFLLLYNSTKEGMVVLSEENGIQSPKHQTQFSIHGTLKNCSKKFSRICTTHEF